MKTPFAALLLFAAVAAVPPASAQSVDCLEVYDFPDNGLWVCIQLDNPDCWVLLVRNTFIGPVETCLVPAPVAQAAASLECMPVHSRTDVGPLSIVRRDSCSPPVVYRCPSEGAPLEQCDPVTDVLRATSMASAAEPECLQVYRETDLGLVRIVSRDSCHAEHYVCGQEKADILANGFDAGRCDAGLSVASAVSFPAPPPNPLGRTCHTEGQGELQSTTCVDPGSADCAVYRRQTTGVGSSWVCYPSGESGSDW